MIYPIPEPLPVMTEPIIYYAVVRIDNGEKVYTGTSLYKAALTLVPGTVWGSGTAQLGATLNAQAEARKARKVI